MFYPKCAITGGCCLFTFNVGPTSLLRAQCHIMWVQPYSYCHLLWAQKNHDCGSERL